MTEDRTKKEEMVEVPCRLLVELDSLLSCLVHRYGSYLEKAKEYDSARRLAKEVRASYEKGD